MAGIFRHTVDFDPGEGEDRRRCRSQQNSAFVTVWSSDGGYVGTRSFDAAQWTTFETAIVTPEGSMILAGLENQYVYRSRVPRLYTVGIDVSELVTGAR